MIAREQIGILLARAKDLTSHRKFVIVGSLSILGSTPTPPPDMMHSIDVDMYLRDDPGRTEEINRVLGEGSEFAEEHGYYADPVSPNLPVLPEQWESRLIPILFADGVIGYFLEPNDAAIAKYARCESRDRRWIRAGLGARIISADLVEQRMPSARFLVQAEHDRAKSALREDVARLAAR